MVFNLICNDFFCFVNQYVFDLILMFINFIFHKIKNWVLPALKLCGLFFLMIIKKEVNKRLDLVHHSFFNFFFVLI